MFGGVIIDSAGGGAIFHLGHPLAWLQLVETMEISHNPLQLNAD